jgi:hypothetical protein
LETNATLLKKTKEQLAKDHDKCAFEKLQLPWRRNCNAVKKCVPLWKHTSLRKPRNSLPRIKTSAHLKIVIALEEKLQRCEEMRASLGTHATLVKKTKEQLAMDQDKCTFEKLHWIDCCTSLILQLSSMPKNKQTWSGN